MYNCYFFSNARTSLSVGIEYLDIKKEEIILIPDYNCISVKNIIKTKKNNFLYYNINNNFTPDWIHINKLLNNHNIAAIISVNYFGFPSNIYEFRKFCIKKKIYLIEDNSHGYSSISNNNALGSIGDISITSFTKQLNVVCGGLLQINKLNNSNFDFYNNLNKKKIKYYDYLKNYIRRHFPYLSNVIRFNFKTKHNYNNPLAFHDNDTEMHLIDNFSLNYIKNFNKMSHMLHRNKSYQIWQDYFKLNFNLNPIFSIYEYPTVSPWCFPLLTYDLSMRNNLLNWAYKNKIIAFTWPSLPYELIESNSQSFQLWEKVICFSLDKIPNKIKYDF